MCAHFAFPTFYASFTCVNKTSVHLIVCMYTDMPACMPDEQLAFALCNDKHHSCKGAYQDGQQIGHRPWHIEGQEADQRERDFVEAADQRVDAWGRGAEEPKRAEAAEPMDGELVTTCTSPVRHTCYQTHASQQTCLIAKPINPLKLATSRKAAFRRSGSSHTRRSSPVSAIRMTQQGRLSRLL